MHLSAFVCTLLYVIDHDHVDSLVMKFQSNFAAKDVRIAMFCPKVIVIEKFGCISAAACF